MKIFWIVLGVIVVILIGVLSFGAGRWTYTAPPPVQITTTPGVPIIQYIQITATPDPTDVLKFDPLPVAIPTLSTNINQDFRQNLDLVAIPVSGVLLPDRASYSVTIQSTTNNDGKPATLLISVDPTSTITVFDDKKILIKDYYSPNGYAAIVPLPAGWSVDVKTTWNDGTVPNDDIGTWNVWEEFYLPRPGFTDTQYRQTIIQYWVLSQTKDTYIWFDGAKFVDLGPTPLENPLP